MKTLNGNIVYKDDIPVSPDDHVNIRIEDVSLMDVAAVIIAEKELKFDEIRTSPIPFSIEYDESKIRENLSYTIRAVIKDKEGRLLLITDTHTPVFTRGGPSDNVDVRVKRIAR
jgi:putative lipoprotein